MPPQGGIIFQIYANGSKNREFQVMPPQGGIWEPGVYGWVEICFKSCPRKGASNTFATANRSIYVSSHAPARGHLVPLRSYPKSCSFKSCPRKGASWCDLPKTNTGLCFKSCPRKGASARQLYFAFRRFQFQVMPPQGGIKNNKLRNFVAAQVSSHAPARGHPRRTAAQTPAS